MPQDHSTKRDAIITLKYPAHVGTSTATTFRAETLRLGDDGSFCALIKEVCRQGSWITIPPVEVWIKEDCVVSRQYVDRSPVQAKFKSMT